MKRLHTILICFLLLFSFFATAQCDLLEECGDLQPSGGLCPGSATFFCEGEEVCFRNTTDPALVDTTIICWGDGVCDVIVGTADAMHIYDFPEDTCLMNSQSLTMPITMTVINSCGNGMISQNCVISFVKIRVTPVANFIPQGNFCVGEEITLANETCDNDDMADYAWDINGQTFSSNEPVVTFDTTGIFPTSLIATNQCGSDTLQQSIWIRDMPQAMTDLSYSDSIGCAPVTITLDNESVDGDFFCWSFTPDEGFTTPFDTLPTFPPDLNVFFFEPDTFELEFIAKNTCGEDTLLLEIPIFDTPSAQLNAPPMACDSLFYTPDISYQGSIDSVNWFFENGIPATSTERQPQDVLFYSGTHQVTLIMNGPCAQDTLTQFLTVNARDNVEFTAPDTICSSSSTITLLANPAGGTWSGSAVNSLGEFDPAQALIGWNTIFYQVGPADCSATDSLEIFVQSSTPVDVGAMVSICIDNGLYQIQFSPQGGLWSGDGIANATMGIFDPNIAQSGMHELTYQFTDPVSECVTIQTKMIEVVGLPDLTALDSTAICDVNQALALDDLLAINFSPIGGLLTCDGAGVSNCDFNPNVAGIAAHPISLTYTIAPGCDTTITSSIEVSSTVQAQTEPDTMACKSEGSLTVEGFPGGGFWSGQQVIEATTGLIDLTDIPVGTHSFTYTLSEGLPCETSAEIEVEIFGGDEVGIAQDSLFVCESENSVALPQAMPQNGQWDSPLPIANGAVNISNVPAGEYILTYTATNLPDVCNSVNLNITVAPLPVVDFEQDSIGCIGDSIVFINNSTIATHYLWDFGNGISSEVNPTNIYTQKGIYNITLDAWTLHPFTNEVLCLQSSNNLIDIAEPPQLIDFHIGNPIDCPDLETNFTNNSIGDELQFEWTFANGETSNLEIPPSITFFQQDPDTTFYEVLLIGENRCGVDSAMHLVSVLPIPDADFGIDFAQPCWGDTLWLNDQSTGSPTNFWWTVGNDSMFNTPVPPFIIPTPQPPDEVTSFPVHLFVENDCGSDFIEKPIEVFPSNVVALFETSGLELCLGETLDLVNESTPGSFTHWEITNLTTGMTNTFTEDTLSFPISDSLSITIFAEGCGFDVFTQKVTTMEAPEVDVATDAAACQGAPIDFEVITNGVGQVLDFGDGASTNFNFSQHTYDTAGFYTYFVTATNTLGCTSTASGQIEIIPKPQAQFVTPEAPCANETRTFESTSVGSVNCEWYFGDINANTNGDCITSFAYDISGVYPVSLVAISSEGCRDTVTQLFQVLPSPFAAFDIEIVDACEPGIIILENQSIDATSIEWAISNGTMASGNIVELTNLNPGTYTVDLLAKTANVCQDAAAANFSIVERPIFDFELEANCVIEDGTDLSILTLPDNFVNVLGDNYDLAGSFHPGLPKGDYQIVVSSVNGCEKIDSVSIFDAPELEINLKQDRFEIPQGQSVQLELLVNQLDLTYQWFPSIWLSDSTLSDPIATPEQSTYYVVTAIDKQGCEKTDTAFIKVNIDRLTDVYVPNVFSPNGDIDNDVFMIFARAAVVEQVNYFRVFSRWGEMVFEADNFQPNDINFGWDGHLDGKVMKPGVFTWIAEVDFVDGTTIMFSGDVALVR